MGAGFGLFILFIIIIRHIGACVKEGVEDAQGRARAEGNGRITYFGSNHEKFKHNNHNCHFKLDQIKGHCWIDLVTREHVWGAKVYGIAEMRQAKAAGKREGTTYLYKDPQGKYFYIDWDTEEVYRVVKFQVFDKGEFKHQTWFYTDFDTMTKVIRKSDNQLLYEAECAKRGINRKFYDISEIRMERDELRSCTTKTFDDYSHFYKCWRVANGETEWGNGFTMNDISFRKELA